jgi:hypothetical protein
MSPLIITIQGDNYLQICLNMIQYPVFNVHFVTGCVNMPKTTQELLQQEITNIAPGLPLAVFQFGFEKDTARAQAELYLISNPAIPFVVRQSEMEGYFALSFHESDGSYSHRLIKLNEKTNKFLTYRATETRPVPYEEQTLSIYVNNCWNPHQNPIQLHTNLNPIQHNKNLNPIQQNKKVAVFSIQSLDQEKVAVSADKLEEFAKNKPGLKTAGDGHTGFAMAKALGAPFVVVRSKENREETNKILKDHLVDNGLLVLTGHGSQDGRVVSGNYVHKQPAQARALFNEQIKRGPDDIVSSVMDGGLKSGNHITILLSICYGAVDTQNTGNSFAHKLAREFAKQGISTTIIASDKTVYRFGYDVIVDDKLTFNGRVGIDPQSVFVFKTRVEAPNEAPQIKVSRFNHTIRLSKAGLEFIDPSRPSEVIILPMDSDLPKVAVPQTPVKVDTPIQQGPKVTPAIKVTPSTTVPAQRLDTDKLVPLKKTDDPKSNPLQTSPQPVDQAAIKLALFNEEKERTFLISQFKADPKLSNVFRSIQNMQNYGDSLFESFIYKGIIARNLAKKLELSLTNFLLESAKKYPNPYEVNQFKINFKKLVNSENKVLQRHRHIWKPIIENILLALTGVGFLAIIAKVVSHLIDASSNKKPVSFNNSFFNGKTRSQHLSEEIGKSINETSLESISIPKYENRSIPGLN